MGACLRADGPITGEACKLEGLKAAVYGSSSSLQYVDYTWKLYHSFLDMRNRWHFNELN